MNEAPSSDKRGTSREPFWAAVVRGYGNLGRGAAALIISASAIAATGAIVVYPLWYFATRSPQAYTGTVLVLVAIAMCLLVGRWYLRERKMADDGFRTPLRKVLWTLARLISVAVLALGLYVDILVFQVGRILAGVLLAAGLVVVVGVLFSGFRRRGDRGRHVA